MSLLSFFFCTWITLHVGVVTKLNREGKTIYHVVTKQSLVSPPMKSIKNEHNFQDVVVV